MLTSQTHEATRHSMRLHPSGLLFGVMLLQTWRVLRHSDDGLGFVVGRERWNCWRDREMWREKGMWVLM